MAPSLSFQLLSAMVAKLGNREDPLPQDSFEGVDEEEWVGPSFKAPAPGGAWGWTAQGSHSLWGALPPGLCWPESWGGGGGARLFSAPSKEHEVLSPFTLARSSLCLSTGLTRQAALRNHDPPFCPDRICPLPLCSWSLAPLPSMNWTTSPLRQECQAVLEAWPPPCCPSDWLLPSEMPKPPPPPPLFPSRLPAPQALCGQPPQGMRKSPAVVGVHQWPPGLLLHRPQSGGLSPRPEGWDPWG